ncbi:hypothetical protein MJO29_012089 [Puccinia striiformis f. sp. tritici]|nr:hypothetical protein Pst134EB_023638 [Puccinia striiformis f. sp. tritici]KAI7945701.1 hypothetical protein MJO29_012089 [Puccinia striiformis f. sp. tritici]
MVGKITDRLKAFEKTLNSINNNNSNPPPPIKSWVSVTKKGLPNQVYRTTNKSPSEIVKIVNNTLASIKAKTADVNLVNIKGLARLPSGDLHFYTQSRFQSNWLWEHKHEWTALCDPTLITPPSSYQAILHSVPISFTPTNRATIAELCRENTINPIVVESTRWFGYPVENNQSHVSIVLNLKDKNLASKIAKGFLFYNGLPLNGAPYKKWLFIL